MRQLGTSSAVDDAVEPQATEWLRRLAAGELSSRELADRCLRRLEETDKRLNAVAAVDGDAVLEAAAEADSARACGDRRPLLGLPLTVKDTIAAAGLPFLSGSFAREEHVAVDDATVVARLREGGAIVLAKTAVPEYAWAYETESALHGRTLSPFDPARTPGGSSGGEAALIAAGASPAGIGERRRRLDSRAEPLQRHRWDTTERPARPGDRLLAPDTRHRRARHELRRADGPERR